VALLKNNYVNEFKMPSMNSPTKQMD